MLKFSTSKVGRKTEAPQQERDDDRDVPDVLDEMSSMGKIRLDD